jgi:hypothetical protein
MRNGVPVASSPEDPLPVAASNISGKFRDAFEKYEPGTGGRWVEEKAAGDLTFIDGNAVGASYFVISKDPLTPGTETSVSLDSALHFQLPIEIALGLSMSQRTLGQAFAVEAVDIEALEDIPDTAIAGISQTTTTLTIDTVAPHGLSIGMSIGVFDCSNPVANYPALTVATVPSPTQITCTAGPGGTIASQTITNPAGAKGSIYFRQRLGRSKNGVSQIFENATVTNAGLYVRSEAGDALPSGTAAGSHSVTVGTTAPIQLVNSPYTYAFGATTEFRLLLQSDRVQFADSAVDAIAQMSSRLVRTQVCPNPEKTFTLRFRATNEKALTVPSAQIVSATKAGSTTATIVTATPHGLVLGDPVVIYGVRDQTATSFPNLLTATSVASVVDATTFTIVQGTSGTATSYGGYVAKVQGGNLMSALGASAIVAQSAVLSTLADGTRQLVLTGNTNWTGLSIGDMAELVGCRNAVDGATLNVDGPWKVANVATTVLTLVLPYADQRVLPADFGSVNCGGGVIKRTCMRVSFVRIFDYERLRVEALARPSGDAAAAFPVAVQGGTSAASQSGTWNIATVTTAGVPPVPATPYFVNSLATTNGALILTGTSSLAAFHATNTGAGAAYVKLYNKATAPTVGTDVPEMIIPVPAAVAGVPGVAPALTLGYIGYRFPLGLGIAITGGAADSDTTAVAAGQVKVKLSRTV